MGRYKVSAEIAAPRERVWSLWTDVHRSKEWVGGVSKVTDVTGPTDQAGTSYVVHFGNWAKSPSTVTEVERPRYIKVKFGNWILRGEQWATLDETPTGTRLTQEFATQGVIPAISSWIFSRGSYGGSFQGELNKFKEICERESRAGTARLEA